MELEKEEIRLIMLGHTGAGKSSAGNYIIGEKVFDSYTGAESKTKQFKEQKCKVNGRNIVIADTPGFFDTKKVDVEKEIQKHLSTFKPNVFLFVITLRNRFPHEAELTLQRIKEMLGQDMYRCSVVVFTATDYLEGTPLPYFVHSQAAHPKVRELVNNCGERFAGFNNHAEGSEREKQVEKLLVQIDKIEDLKEYIIPSRASESSTDGDRSIVKRFSNSVMSIGANFTPRSSFIKMLSFLFFGSGGATDGDSSYRTRIYNSAGGYFNQSWIQNIRPLCGAAKDADDENYSNDNTFTEIERCDEV